ncbi:MAG: EFR1 family ferrodoxin [Ruminococcus sp.]|nr:EFR1 family ferrodoxin [Ruminococcus sp.]
MIFYFSATGNSKYFAKAVCAASGEKPVSITKAVQNGEYDYTVQSGETLGFIMPVYFSGIPSAVLEFLDGLHINASGAGYVFTGLTCGGTTAAAGKMLKTALSKKGIIVDAEFAVKMVDNYIPMFAIDGKEEATARLETANREIDELARKITAKQKGDFNSIKGTQFMTKIMYPLYKPMSKTKKFHVTEKCIGCGKCANGCVCSAIEMQNGRPVWVKANCTSCMRCIHSCPAKAIEWGRGTAKRNRYINPYV